MTPMRVAARRGHRRAHPRTAAALVAVLTLTATAAAAQDAAGYGDVVPHELTLEAARRLARAHNPAYQRTVHELAGAEADRRASVAAFLPSLSANVNFSGARSRIFTGEDEFGRPIPVPGDSVIQSDWSTSSQALSLNVPVFAGGRRLAEVRAARATGRAAEAAIEAEAIRLRADVTRRYYEAVLAEHVVELEAMLLEASREQLEATRRLMRVVAAQPDDVLGAEVQVATREQALQRARGDARKARLGLLEVMGVDADADAFELASGFPDVFDPASLDIGQLAALALDASPEIGRMEALVAAAGARVDAARGQRWPEVNATAGFGRSIGVSSYRALFDLNPRNQAFTFGLNVSIPLFTRLQTSRSIAQAEVVRSAAEQELRARRLAIAREVRGALIDLENAHEAVALAARSAELSQRRVEMMRERYLQGAVGFVDLQLAEEQAARTGREALDARVAFVQAHAALEEAVGREVRP